MRVKFLLVFIVLNTVCRSQNFVIEYNHIIIKTIMEDLMSPPVASRVHLYSNIAAYEVLIQHNPSFKSISGQITHFPVVTESNIKVNDTVAAATALLFSAKKYIFSEHIIDDFFENEKSKWYTRLKDTTLVDSSINYGKRVAERVFLWSKKDNYDHTRTLHRYELNDSLGAWRPTPPEYNNALEPNWFMLRSLVFPKDSFLDFIPNFEYSESKKSVFYKNAKEVYDKTNHLTNDERDIALYWDDNPVTTVSKGHVSYVIKKPSPGAHWLKIMSQRASESKYNLYETAELLTMASIGMYEAFIQCWHTKYITNSIRPINYINRIIDPKWTCLIETPPFPEYTSGHSVLSGCISTVGANYLGDKTAFVDSSQIFIGLKPRRFKSLYLAAEEASISRFYGGIHYKPSLWNGLIQGRNLAKLILTKIKTR